MLETLGLAGPCRSLFAQRTSPGAWEERRYLIISRIAMALQALSIGSVRLFKGNKTSIDGQLPQARLEFLRSTKSYSSNIGTWRASLGPPFRWRRAAPMTASTVKDSSAVRGTKMRCVLDR